MRKFVSSGHMGLHRAQTAPASSADCSAFFSDPRDLAEITPPFLDFRVLSELRETPLRMTGLS